MTEKCQYCKRLLDDPKDPTTKDCGGDCLRCMGEIFEDPDCIIEMLNIRIEALREALRNIQIEAEREQGSWVHLKRVIALNCKQTLAALEQSK